MWEIKSSFPAVLTLLSQHPVITSPCYYNTVITTSCYYNSLLSQHPATTAESTENSHINIREGSQSSISS